ncbi:WD40/YVTN/BNR-like repeat-containing protein, partial [Arenimonas sp.]|uniref:WD40/YVTN/BNR-like repeat-containing protein n=1 Tax=Arenimonas sp. TaxID=1872635 RepID=UPI0039E3A016
MSMRRSLVAAISCLLLSFAAAGQDVSHAPEDQAPEIEVLVSPVTVRLYAACPPSTRTLPGPAAAKGTVLRTIDAGKTWSVFKVPGAEKLDFRDVEGFSAKEAVVLSIGPGEDSRVSTSDAGKTWILALQNRDPRACSIALISKATKGTLWAIRSMVGFSCWPRRIAADPGLQCKGPKPFKAKPHLPRADPAYCSNHSACCP